MAGIWKNIGRRMAKLLPAFGIGNGAALSYLGGVRASKTGINVTPETAIGSSAVLACVRVVSETMAQMPVHVYRSDGKSKDLAKKHPLYRLLHDAPNPYITSFELREWLQNSIMIHGNGYALIDWDRAGRPRELWPLYSQNVSPETKNGQMVYRYYYDGKQRFFAHDEILHIRGFAVDGILGRSLTDIAREDVGLSIAQRDYASKIFASGGTERGVLEHPERLSKDSADNLKASWNATYGSVDNAHKVAVLEEGMTFKTIGINPSTAQLIEGRTFQVAEVARAFRMPLHMIQELSRATFSNIEQQALEFVKYTMMPWIARWEQRCNMQLLLAADKREGNEHYVKFSVDGLLRGDSKSRAEFYKLLREIGVLSVNEIRGLEDLNPLGEEGDARIVPLNMSPLEALLEYAEQAGGEEAQRAVVIDLVARALPSRSRQGLKVHGPLIGADISGASARGIGAVSPDGDGEASFDRCVVEAPLKVGRAALKKEEARWADYRARLSQAEERRRLRERFVPLGVEAAKRLIRGDVRELRKLAKKHLGSREFVELWGGAVERYFREEGAAFARRIMGPVFRSVVESVGEVALREAGLDEGDVEYFIEVFMSDFVRQHGEIGLQDLRDIELENGAEVVFERWLAERPDRIGAAETRRAAEAVTVGIWAAAGLSYIWHAFGDSCPLCNQLHGRNVGPGGTFVSSGEAVDPEDGETAEFVPKAPIRNPPLHAGCDCSVRLM